MKIVLEKTKWHKFAFYYDFDPTVVLFCRDIKDAFTWKEFSFDKQGSINRWVFSKDSIIEVIKAKFPSVEIGFDVIEAVKREKLEAENEKNKTINVNSVLAKTDTTFDVKGLKRPLYNYQKIGVEFLVAAGGRAIVADPPGLGKTAQSLGFIRYMDYSRVLIVCPASVKYSWEKECKKWTNFSSIVIDSKTDISNIDSSVKVWIINYDILKKHFSQLSKIKFDTIIGDEAQLLKSTTIIRTKAFKQLSLNIPSVVLLSGTPILSRPSEIFSLLNIVDPKTWNNFFSFAKRYCNMQQTRWGMDTSGSSNEEELHEKIKGYFIRRKKEDVLKELPPKVFVDVPVLLDKDYKKKYDSAASNLAIYLREHAGKKDPEIKKAMAAEKLTQLNVLRHLSSLGKINTVIELIESIIDSGEKVLVFSSFVKPLEVLGEKFKDKSVMITGKTPVGIRGEIVSKFQEDKNTMVFLGGMSSASTGITLTSASNVIFLDYSWVPSLMIQAQDRVHRPGQLSSSVNIYQLVSKDTIDEDMKDTLYRKQSIINKVIDGEFDEENAEKSTERSIERIMNNY